MRNTVVLEPCELCVCLTRETINSSRSKTGPGNWAQSNVEEAAGLVSPLGGKSVYFLSDYLHGQSHRPSEVFYSTLVSG